MNYLIFIFAPQEEYYPFDNLQEVREFIKNNKGFYSFEVYKTTLKEIHHMDTEEYAL